MVNQLKIGSRVVFKNQHISREKMTVNQFTDNYFLECFWISKDGHLNTGVFHSDLLEIVDSKGEEPFIMNM